MKSSHVSGVTRTYHWRIFDAKTKQLVHPTPWSSLILPFKMMPTENTMNIVGNPWENPSIFTRLHFYIKHQKKIPPKLGLAVWVYRIFFSLFLGDVKGFSQPPGPSSGKGQDVLCLFRPVDGHLTDDRHGLTQLPEDLAFSPRGSWKGRVLWKRIRA